LVIAPYATVMASAGRAASRTAKHATPGADGRPGALRFFTRRLITTPERLPKNQTQVIIHSFMAHHQGMSLVALDNVLHDDVMQRRFHSDPLIQATELLLQERIRKAPHRPLPHRRDVDGAYRQHA